MLSKTRSKGRKRKEYHHESASKCSPVVPVGRLSRSLQKFTNVLLEGSSWGAELDEEFVEVLAGELPFEGLSRSCPVVLKVQQPLGDRIEIGKIVGRQDLSLNDREIDLGAATLERRLTTCES
jgi:hypothetical protein